MTFSQIAQTLSTSSSSSSPSTSSNSITRDEITSFLKDIIIRLNDDLTRRRRVYDLLILAIGVTIGILLYSLAHDLIVDPQECESSTESGIEIERREREHDLEYCIEGISNTNQGQDPKVNGKPSSGAEVKEGMLVDISEKI